MKILVINGPNLNLLGEREPAVYGGDSLQAINDELFTRAKRMGYDMAFFQSSNEGSIIDRLHDSRLDCAGVILNAGAYTHYSYAIRDAIAAINIPNRDEFRKTSVIAPVCRGSIAGFGKISYMLALNALDYLFGEQK